MPGAGAKHGRRSAGSAQAVLDIVKMNAFDLFAAIEKIALQGKANARKRDFRPGNPRLVK
jgi:hypothetical protein